MCLYFLIKINHHFQLRIIHTNTQWEKKNSRRRENWKGQGLIWWCWEGVDWFGQIGNLHGGHEHWRLTWLANHEWRRGELWSNWSKTVGSVGKKTKISFCGSGRCFGLNLRNCHFIIFSRRPHWDWVFVVWWF